MKVKSLIWDEIENDTEDPVTLYPETTPAWLSESPVRAIETPQEEYRRIEREFKRLDLARKQAAAAFEARIEAIDDRELFLLERRNRVLEQLENEGEDV